MGDPAPHTAPVTPKDILKGKGRWFLVLIFCLFLVFLVVLPPTNQKSKSNVFQLVLKGDGAVSSQTVTYWVGPDPLSRMGSRDLIRLWVYHHPWVKTAALVRQLWGGGSIVINLHKAKAVLRPPTSFSPGQPSFPWGKPRILPYLLSTGKVVTGLSVPSFRDLPEVILETPMKSGSGNHLLKVIREERRCRDHGAPEGKIFIFRGKHEIRMIPDHASYYLVLPEGSGCEPFRMLRQLLRSHRVDSEGHLSGGEGAVIGIDLRFSKMILLRRALPKTPLSKSPSSRGKL
jgi:hypothetical protein